MNTAPTRNSQTGAGPEPGTGTPTPHLEDCAGAILAGGRGRRMGGGLKALQPMAGRPLLQHVIDRLAPQVASLALSVESVNEYFAPFGLAQVPDPVPGSRGPLGGLLAVLGHAAAHGHEWLLLAPCDAPFLPLDLAARLHDCALDRGAQAVAIAHRGRLHPVFSLWHRALLGELEQAVGGQGMGGFKAFLATRPHAILDWPDGGPDPFFNINDPAALQHAALRATENEGCHP